jgi:hypothetical protein
MSGPKGLKVLKFEKFGGSRTLDATTFGTSDAFLNGSPEIKRHFCPSFLVSGFGSETSCETMAVKSPKVPSGLLY